MDVQARPSATPGGGWGYNFSLGGSCRGAEVQGCRGTGYLMYRGAVVQRCRGAAPGEDGFAHEVLKVVHRYVDALLLVLHHLQEHCLTIGNTI